MKNKKMVVLTAVFACLTAVFCLALISPVLADVGNSFSGGSSGGGSSYSGSYRGSSSGGSGLGGLIFLSNSPLGIVVVLIVAAVVIYSARNKHAAGAGHPYSVSNLQSNAGLDETAVVEKVAAQDPHFSAEQFKAYVSEVWLSVQEAWEKKDWHKVRPFESNTLFNVHQRQLQEYIDGKKTNYLNMQNIRDVTIAAFETDGDYELLRVKLDASLLDYVLDDESGELLEGSKKEYAHRSYKLEFIRKKGVGTIEQEGTAVTNCPNCGAPTQVTSSGQCEYCKSVITNGDFGWVLNKYAPW